MKSREKKNKNKLRTKRKKFVMNKTNQRTTITRCNLKKKKKQNLFQHFSHTERIDSPSAFKRHRIDSRFFKNHKIDSPPTVKNHKIDSLLPLKATESILSYL